MPAGTPLAHVATSDQRTASSTAILSQTDGGERNKQTNKLIKRTNKQTKTLYSSTRDWKGKLDF